MFCQIFGIHKIEINTPLLRLSKYKVSISTNSTGQKHFPSWQVRKSVLLGGGFFSIICVPAMRGCAGHGRKAVVVHSTNRPEMRFLSQETCSLKTSIWVNSQGGKRPSGWHVRQGCYQPTLFDKIFHRYYLDKEFAMKIGIIFFVTDCGEFFPSGRGRPLNWAFSKWAFYKIQS